MSIIRVKKDARYFAASNEPFNDERLSWEARGLMGYLLSKPDDWEVRQMDLERRGPAGGYKIKKMLAELRAYGYVNRYRITNPDQTFTWMTVVYESPSKNPNPSKQVIKLTSSGRFSTSGRSTSGKLHHILSTEIPSTDLKEQEDDEGRLPITIKNAYEAEIGKMSAGIKKELLEALQSYSEKWITDAIHESTVQNKRRWSYAKAILKRWGTQGNQKPEPFKRANRYG
jgi:DnaD/phage-associated family protein